MEKLQKTIEYLRNYDGRELTFMEVCGSHTAAIAKNGIKDLLSDKIHLISGPGCPVCVTPSSYIDRLIALSKQENTCVVTFGDLLRVPGSAESLNEAKSDGAKVEMVYSPLDILKLARQKPEITYVFAAVGFETTVPTYALLLEELQEQHIENVKFLTSLKTMPQAIRFLCERNKKIDGFLAPGHVAVITGSDSFLPLAKEYKKPFVVAGFEAEELLLAIHALVQMADQNGGVKNFYPRAVTGRGNVIAQEKIGTYFEPAAAVWRGIGEIEDSGLVLREEYRRYDAGSYDLKADKKTKNGCCCDKILIGEMESEQCPLFGKICTPNNPQGACMVSFEGSCYQKYRNR